MNASWKRSIFFVGGLLVCSLFLHPVSAQEDIFGIERKLKGRKSENELGNVFRNMVSNFSFELTTGAGYQQQLFDFASETPGAYAITGNPEGALDPAAGDTLSFSSGNVAFPLGVGVRINVFDFLTFGAGYGRETGRISPLTAAGYTLEFQDQAYTYDKLYGTVGLILWDAGKRGSFLRWRYRKYSENNLYMQSELKQRARQIYPWRFILEGEFGSLFLRRSPDPNLTAPDPYYGFAARLEYDFSEYTKVFVRPAVEFRPFTYTNPAIPESQSLRQQVYTLQVGVALHLPGTKRCKVGGCRVVMKHLHNGVEYRGSSIWHRQHRKVGQW